MMNLVRILSVLACLLLCPALQAAPVVIDFDEANPPFMFAREGNAAGIYPAVISAAFKHMRVPVNLQSRPWARCLLELEQDGVGVGGIYKNAEREQKYDYSAPIFVEKLEVYSLRSHPVRFTRLEDLRGLRVGILRGWSYGDAFDAARRNGLFIVEDTASDELNFRKLELGRLDLLIAVSEAGDALLPAHRGIVASPRPLLYNQSYLAFAKTSGRAGLLRQFNEALAAMKASGEFGRILAEKLNKR